MVLVSCSDDDPIYRPGSPSGAAFPTSKRHHSANTRLCAHSTCYAGDAAVGKSSCVERFVKNEFFDFQQPTIGAAFLTQTVQVGENIVKFEIWDTAGTDLRG